MIRRFLIVTLVLLAACATVDDDGEDNLASDESRPRYSPEAGTSPVGVIPDAVIRDAERDKDLTVNIEYPTRPGPHPLIIFSHGFGGSNRSYVGLSSYWASKGYVVMKPAHADSSRQPGVRELEDIWESQTPADWRNRVRDVTFLIDSLDKIEQQFPELAGKIDKSRIGVGGHSYGAHTAMLVGGARTFPGGVSYADPRVKAIIAMSPQGPSEIRGLTRESWAELRTPALFMTGTRDRGISDAETPEWRREAFELSPAGDKWLIVLPDAGHAVFTGRMERFTEAQAREEARRGDPLDPDDPRDPQARTRRPRARGAAEGLAARARSSFAQIKVLSLAFWDAYLRGDAPGREQLEKAADRGVELKRK